MPNFRIKSQNFTPLAFPRILQLVGIGSIFLLSLYALDSDPSPLKINSDLVDEAIWMHNARSKVLFGSSIIQPDYINYGGIGGPLFNFILKIFFTIGGANLIAARLLSLFSFWALLLFIYFLFRRCNYSILKSTLPCFILGFNHQSLIFSKWATPIFLQITFLSISFYLPIFAIDTPYKNIKKILLFISGLAFSAAVASKGTGINMFPAYFATIIFLFAIAKKISLFDLLHLCSGVLLGVIGILITLFSNYKYLKLFPLFIVDFSASKKVHGAIEIISTIATSPGMANPMVALLCASAIGLFTIRTIQALDPNQNRDKNSIFKKSNLLEWVSLIWLIFGHLGILAFMEFPIYRRYLPFIVPLSILFSRLIFTLNHEKFLKRKQIEKIWFGLILSTVILFYWYQSELYINMNWLTPSNSKEVNFLQTHIWPYFFCASMILVLTTFRAGLKILSAILVFTTICTNLAFSYEWLKSSTFTIRDESRRLGQLASLGDIATGFSPWTLSTESSLLPIYFNKSIKSQISDLTDFPAGLPSKSRHLFLLSLVKSIGITDGFFDPYLTSLDFTQIKASSLGEFKLMPYPGTESYRLVYQITKLEPL